MIVDTHAHLADTVFDVDRPEVVERAAVAGLGAIVVVAEDASSSEKVLDLCRGHAMLRAAVGLHPARADEAEADFVVRLIRDRRAEIVAIGEVGLDHWLAKDDAARELQARVFDRFIDVSLELDLPLNVHTRSAGRVVIDRLLRRGARRVQLHAFDGRASTAQPAVEAGFYFSVPASVVHSQQKRKLVRALPLERLLLETDSPVLAPVEGERNEPANAVVAAREIAALKGLDLEAVLEATWVNTRALYGTALSTPSRV